MRALRSESEVIKTWKRIFHEPLVSVMCLAYNHQNYIEDALVGFLIQETNFPFEVLIHDDASTDRTADIIREYQAAYPNIIKPVYQTENQWSKDKEVIRKAQYDRVKGVYLAYCEGDDYWTDPSKLQTQVELLEKNQDINICFHPVYWFDQENCSIKNTNYGAPGIKKKYTLDELLLYSNFIPTASIVIRKHCIDHQPVWFDLCIFKDFAMVISAVLTSKNKILMSCMVPMAVYRHHRGGVHSGESEIVNSLRLLETYKQFALEPQINKLPAYKRAVKMRKKEYMQALIRGVKFTLIVNSFYRHKKLISLEDVYKYVIIEYFKCFVTKLKYRIKKIILLHKMCLKLKI
ncbi:MAG: glycosyltransferase family 2 protein [Chlorobium sp.]